MFNIKSFLFISFMFVLLCIACAAEKQSSSNIPPVPSMNDIEKKQTWVNIVGMRFKHVWQMPQDQRISPEMEVTYTIKISQSGEIISKKMIISSGNKAFDLSVEDALNRIKLPPPPGGRYEWTLSFVPPYGN
jgi:TonB family protein